MIRLAFNLLFLGFLALLVLPSLVPADHDPDVSITSQPAQMDVPTDIARLAGGIATELGSLCLRQPTICESGAALAASTLARARHGWEIASGMLAPAETEPLDTVETGGI